MLKNTILFPTPFILSGEISLINEVQTEIIFEVEPIRFGYYWLKYMAIFGIFIFNLILYTRSAPLEIYQIINPILFSFIILSRFYLWRKKNKLVADFKRIFEIE